MTNAVKVRDAKRQQILGLLGEGVAENEHLPDVDSGTVESEELKRESQDSQLSDNDSDSIQDADDDSEIEQPVKIVTTPEIESVVGAEKPDETATDSELDIEARVVGQVLDFASKGEVSRAYWLLWAQKQLGGSVGLPPVGVRCLGQAGQLTSSNLPGPGLKQSLAEFSEEDLSKFENRILALATVIPTALFCQQKPNWLYAVVNQLRSGVGEVALNDLFEAVASNCIDQDLWVSDRAISSVAVRSDRSEKLRSLRKGP
jgi:hypothetical protein